MKPPDNIPRPVTLVCLSLALLLAGMATYLAFRPRPRFTMAELDAKAKPFIEEATAAIPEVVSKLCRHKCRLYWLMLKDKCTNGTRTRDYIRKAIEPQIIVPLRKAAAVYACALNADAVPEMATEAALDNLSRQLYATAGLAIEAVFIKATIDSCIHVLCVCAPKLAASWGIAGACALADGPVPIGDIIGITIAVGGTLWCAWDIYQAFKALPAELTIALQNAVAATVAQCRLEAASAL